MYICEPECTVPKLYCVYFVRIDIFRWEANLYMSVPDVMGEGHILNILSITAQNLHYVRVWFPAVKYYEFIGQ